ncbi:MAG: ABC transporter permease [Spirochaetota bacterium]
MNCGVFLTVVAKEVVCLFRDAKTVAVSLLVPLLLFPLTFTVVRLTEESLAGQTAETQRIATTTGVPDTLLAYLREVDGIAVVPMAADAAQTALAAGDVAAILTTSPGPSGHEDDSAKDATVCLVVDSSRTSSLAAAETLATAIQGHNDALTIEGLRTAGVDPDTLPRLVPHVHDIGPGRGVALLATILPLLLMVATAVTPMPSASDVGAGEKERRTIAPLLATGAGRVDIIAGKLVAVSTMGLLGAAAFVGGVVFSTAINPDLFGAVRPALASWRDAMTIAVVTALLSLVFAATELTFSLLARSSKEAQTYLLPLLVISVGAGYLATRIDPSRVPILAYHVPLVNAGALIRSAALGQTLPWQSVVVGAWMVGYALVAAYAAWRLLRREAVLF